MKNLSIITIIFISIGIISCQPCKRLSRKCPPVIRDSVSYVETVKFDTITLVSPADTLIIRIPVEPDINDLIVDVADKPGPSVLVKIESGVMEIIAICPEDSLKTIIAGLETELNNQTTITVEKEVPVKYTSKFARIAIIWLFVSALLLVLVIYLKIKGGMLKTVFNRFR